MHESGVAFFERSGGNLAVQRRGGSLRLCKDHHPADGPVQPVDRIDRAARLRFQQPDKIGLRAVCAL